MKRKYNNSLPEFLDIYQISTRQCFDLAKVNRTTFNRWLNGVSNPPFATLELFRLHATGEPPSTSIEWHGWCFTQGKLFTPANRGFEPHEIAQIPDFYRDRAILREIQKNYALQSKLF
ncbi:MAG: hypothetical protein V4605_08905 [Pseudomonadota bacterium]